MLASAVVYDTVSMPIIGPYVNTLFFLLEFVTAGLFHQWMFVRLFNHELDISNWVKASKFTDSIKPEEDPTTLSPTIQRLGSYLVRLFEYSWPNADHDFDDGFFDPNDSDDAEHFSMFGASIVQTTAGNLKKQAIQASIELNQVKLILMLLLCIFIWYAGAH